MYCTVLLNKLVLGLTIAIAIAIAITIVIPRMALTPGPRHQGKARFKEGKERGLTGGHF